MDRHGGNLRELAHEAGGAMKDINDFSVSINPLGFPEWTRTLISAHVSLLTRYPDIHYTALREEIAVYHGVSCDEVVACNGASEAIFHLPRLFSDARAKRAIIPIPTFSDYERSAQLAGFEVDYLAMDAPHFSLDLTVLRRRLEAWPGKKTLVFLGHPNNPVGKLLDYEPVVTLINEFPAAIFIIDEAFIDFVDNAPSFISCGLANVIVIRSLTKILSLPGLRMGYVIASKELAAMLQATLPSWSLGSLAEAVARRALGDTEFFTSSRIEVGKLRKLLAQALEETIGINVVSGTANYLLLRIATGDNGVGSTASFCRRLLVEHKIAVRNAATFSGLEEGYLRVAVKKKSDNESLLRALKAILASHDEADTNQPKPQRRARALMLLGTGSSVGKSVLTAALCRVLYQDGYKVAPFKAQNMANNSFVTADGGEIGRAQAVQAIAAKVDIDVRMNPILLKPNSDTGSQVIVNGKAVKNMDFRVYAEYKPTAFAAVKKAYDSLASEYDVIVLEGAGSASEVNLKKDDIVNMKMADYADADVFLVADIDRGGAFGGLIGTMETMAEWERKRVKGLIINRFRGISSLLNPGIDYLEKTLGVPLLGVVPYIDKINIPDEDSVAFKEGGFDDKTPLGGRLDVVVIDTPKISNFTDLMPLRLESDVRLRTVHSALDLGVPDLIILPGSKSVMSDLAFLFERGLAAAIKGLITKGQTKVLGICGGYQMLGIAIEDSLGIESPVAEMKALALLPVVTKLGPEKILGRTRGYYGPGELAVDGYEIHHGFTEPVAPLPLYLRRPDGSALGYSDANGRVMGTYLHGVFDSDLYRRAFLDELRIAKGLGPLGKGAVSGNLEKALDHVADLFRRHIDLGLIERLLDD